MKKLELKTHNVTKRNLEIIASAFPHCVTEVMVDDETTLAIDFEKLKEELSEELCGDRDARYEFTWPGKQSASRLASQRTDMTLRPVREESVDFDNTQNLYIEGDNLEVLKVLRETYLGKVKMIYIDPPYNTGNDFISLLSKIIRF